MHRYPLLLAFAQIVIFECTALADTVMIDLPAVSNYSSISAAYSAAADGATVKLREAAFSENLSFATSKSVNIEGGYNYDFTAVTGYSIVRGKITVSAGNVHVKDIVIVSAGDVPGTPIGVTATAGIAPNTVTVSFGAADSGGSPITGYTVTSSPAGITATGAESPITVACPITCAGYAFAVYAANSAGSGVLSAPTDVITTYDVTETFFEPETQPSNSIFIGSFTLNSTAGVVTNLQGILSESMTAGPDGAMTWLSIGNQLSSIYDPTLGGLLVTTFMLNTTNTFSTNPAFNGTDGWSPGTGFGLYYGFPGTNPGNAYARIFVNTANPTAALSQTQIDKLAYADCSPGGMMGAACMTGTTVEGYGTLGTMSGYPVSQVITKQ